MPTDTRVNRAILTQLARQPWVATTCERIGAHTIADKLDRVATNGDIVALTLPSLPTELRARRVKMYRVGGRDHVANSFAQSGWFGFERPLPSVLRLAVAATHGMVLDVGANTGFYSLLAARTAPGRPIYAFEPLPDVIRRLEANLDLNGLRERVTIVASAVGAEDGEAKLFVPEPTGEIIESSASLNADFKEHHSEVLTVPVTTLDTFWRSKGSGAVSVVKIDVEGFEDAVLGGASRLLEQARPIVFFEVLPGSEVKAIEAVADRAGYIDCRLRAFDAVIGDAIQFDPDGWNHALVPAERADELTAIVQRAGLLVTQV